MARTRKDDLLNWESAIGNLIRGHHACPHLAHAPYGWAEQRRPKHGSPLVGQDDVPGYVLVVDTDTKGGVSLTAYRDEWVLEWWDAAQSWLATQPRDDGVSDEDLVAAAVSTMCAEVMEELHDRAVEAG